MNGRRGLTTAGLIDIVPIVSTSLTLLSPLVLMEPPFENTI